MDISSEPTGSDSFNPTKKNQFHPKFEECRSPGSKNRFRAGQKKETQMSEKRFRLTRVC